MYLFPFVICGMNFQHDSFETVSTYRNMANVPGPLCANIIISFESKMRVQMCSLEKRDTRYGCKSSTILDGRQTNGGTCATYMHNQERKRT